MRILFAAVALLLTAGSVPAAEAGGGENFFQITIESREGVCPVIGVWPVEKSMNDDKFLRQRLWALRILGVKPLIFLHEDGRAPHEANRWMHTTHSLSGYVAGDPSVGVKKFRTNLQELLDQNQGGTR